MSIKTLLAAFLLSFALSVTAADVQLNPDHPQEYTVVKGDTLWDIASRFLKDPWRWPDVWQVNPQIENPHLIYPGDQINLAYDKDGKPILRVKRGRQTVKLSPTVRESPIDRAIPTIPLDAIQQFLTRPLVVSEEQLDSAAYLVAPAGEHLVVGAGDRIYVRNIKDEKNIRYSIFRKGQELKSPDSDELLGYEAIFVGEATAQRFGDPSTLSVDSTQRHAAIGDRLLPVDESDVDEFFMPHAPKNKVAGHIIAVDDGVSNIGQYDVVVIDKGKRDGIERGHVLEVFQTGEKVLDHVTPELNDRVKLPDEKAGLLMVFRTFDKVSYALVMKATINFHVLDGVRNPDNL